MRKRFEQQLGLGQLPIEEIYINPKSKNALDELVLALKSIYCNKEYNEKIFCILENTLIQAKKILEEPEWICGVFLYYHKYVFA